MSNSNLRLIRQRPESQKTSKYFFLPKHFGIFLFLLAIGVGALINLFEDGPRITVPYVV